jgi:cell division protein FtsZ
MAVELKPRIVVIGVGGAGGNAITNMIQSGLQGVEFIAANTDAQALVRTGAPVMVQLGAQRTAGLGAGANPEVGAEAAAESADEIRERLKGCHMCFIAAGMGGGTGTGAAPIIARIAKELGILTVGVVTKPFDFEGRRRMAIAERGVAELRPEVDTLIIIPNQNLRRLASRETTWTSAFKLADEVLHAGVRGITDLMVMPGLINLDFADVRTVMEGMGTAMMGTGEGEGEGRALKAARAAVANPLLDDVSMKGAKGVLVNITGGPDLTLFEVDEVVNEVRREVDADAHIILGSTFDETMTGRMRVSVVAAGVEQAEPARAAPPAPQPLPARPQAPAPTAEPARSSSPILGGVSPLFNPQPVQIQVGPAPEAPATPERPVIRPRPSKVTGANDLEQFGADEEEAKEGAAPVEAPARSFGSLFGSRNKGDAAKAPDAAAVTVEAEPETDDLEIPAFLRRSASN